MSVKDELNSYLLIENNVINKLKIIEDFENELKAKNFQSLVSTRAGDDFAVFNLDVWGGVLSVYIHGVKFRWGSKNLYTCLKNKSDRLVLENYIKHKFRKNIILTQLFLIDKQIPFLNLQLEKHRDINNPWIVGYGCTKEDKWMIDKIKDHMPITEDVKYGGWLIVKDCALENIPEIPETANCNVFLGCWGGDFT